MHSVENKTLWTYKPEVHAAGAEIPHVLHMIWFGDEIPGLYLSRAVLWAKRNPGWQVKLWVDDESKYAALKQQLAEQRVEIIVPASIKTPPILSLLDPAKLTISSDNLKQLGIDFIASLQGENRKKTEFLRSLCKHIWQKNEDILKVIADDIGTIGAVLKEFSALVIKEIDGKVSSLQNYEGLKEAEIFKMSILEQCQLTPNYGAASDLVRLHALYEFGGVYVDTDIVVGEPFPTDFRTKHGILLGSKSVNRDAELWYINDKRLVSLMLSNDMIAVPKHSDLIKEASVTMSKNAQRILLHLTNQKSKWLATIETTGPDMIRKCIPVEKEKTLHHVCWGAMDAYHHFLNALDVISEHSISIEDICKENAFLSISEDINAKLVILNQSIINNVIELEDSVYLMLSLTSVALKIIGEESTIDREKKKAYLDKIMLINKDLNEILKKLCEKVKVIEDYVFPPQCAGKGTANSWSRYASKERVQIALLEEEHIKYQLKIEHSLNYDDTFIRQMAHDEFLELLPISRLLKSWIPLDEAS